MVPPCVYQVSQKARVSYLLAVDSSRQLSRVRIHLERVFSRWKSIKILHSVIPISQVSLLDDIVIVCGALTNLCKSVVPRKESACPV